MLVTLVAMRIAFALGLCLAAGVLTTSTMTEGRFSALPREGAVSIATASPPARVALGRLLFWDPVLSGNNDVACATCHHPDFAYSDGRDLSLGTNAVGLGPARRGAGARPTVPVRRNSPTLVNVAFNGLTLDKVGNGADAPMFWDLRVRSLERQALEPIKAHDEMRGDAYSDRDAVPAVVARLAANAEYRRLFAAAFSDRDAVNATNLGRALAVFERTLVASNSPFDRYMRGETGAMTDEQVRGMERFESAGCANCHSGSMFSDFAPHVLGIPDNPALAESDAGAGAYEFRTPSLRNVGLTAPYMHDGVFRSLDEVLNFYRRVSFGRGQGGRGRFGSAQRGVNPNVSRDTLDPLLRQLNMRGRGRREIIAFLQALDDPDFDRAVPARVPSGLEVGGRIARETSRTATVTAQ
jgi:cytochrome c peroxidase